MNMWTLWKVEQLSYTLLQIQQKNISRYIHIIYILRRSFETWVRKGKKYNLF